MKKRAMERTCIFVISDCLPFSRQIDFYISCYWKLSRLDCQACLALASAAKPVSGLYDLALGRTFKAFNSQVISMIQYCFCPNHLCCFLSLSAASHSLFLFFPFHLSFPNPFFINWKWVAKTLAFLFLVHTCLFAEKVDLLHHDGLTIKQKRRAIGHTHTKSLQLTFKACCGASRVEAG